MRNALFIGIVLVLVTAICQVSLKGHPRLIGLMDAATAVFWLIDAMDLMHGGNTLYAVADVAVCTIYTADALSRFTGKKI